MLDKIKKFLFPKEEEFKYRVLVQEQPERKVEVVKAANKKAPAKKKPAVKKPAPAKKPAKKTTKKK